MIELIIVVSILGIVSTTVVLAVEPIRRFALDNATDQVLHALRFAQRQALDTGRPFGVSFQQSSGLVRVHEYRLQGGTLNKVAVQHPLQKKDYEVQLDSLPLAGTAIALQAKFTFTDGSTAPEVGFNARGEPGKVTSLTTIEPIKEPGNWRGFWRPLDSYALDDWVEHNAVLYDAAAAHIAGSSFEADLDAGRWKLRVQPGQVTVSAGSHRHDVHVEPVFGFARRHTP